MSVRAFIAAMAIVIIAFGVAAFAIWYITTYGSRRNVFYVDPVLEEAVNGKPMVIKVSSPAFSFGGEIPQRYTCDGEDYSPPIRIDGVPVNARSLVLIMYDPDAPKGTFYHWIMYNIPPKNITLPENIPAKPETPYGLQGVNDFGVVGYKGPCPPPGLGKHRYYILVMALDTILDLKPGASKEEVINALKDHVIAYGYYMGVYGR